MPCVHSHGSYGHLTLSTRPGCAGSEICLSGPDYSRPSCLQSMIARLAAGSCSAGCGTLFALIGFIHCTFIVTDGYTCRFCCTDFVGSLSAPYLILFGFARLTIGLNGPGPFCMDIFHSGRLPICIFVLLYCVSYLLFLGAGFLAGGGEGGSR